MREPFATTADLQEYWRTLSPDEVKRAIALLALARPLAYDGTACRY